MYLILILLSIAVHSVHSQQPSDYTRNSVYYAGQIMPTVPSTEQSSQDVLKELGVDLSNEGRPNFIKFHSVFKDIYQDFFFLTGLFKVQCKMQTSIFYLKHQGRKSFFKKCNSPLSTSKDLFFCFPDIKPKTCFKNMSICIMYCKLKRK